MSELGAIRTAITAACAANDGLSDLLVWSGAVPQGEAFPAIVFASYGGPGDASGPGASRMLTRADYIVKVIGKAESFAPLEAPVTKLDETLQAGAWTVTAGGKQYQVTCHRLYPLEDTKRVPVGNSFVEYRHVGGIYQFFVSEAG